MKVILEDESVDELCIRIGVPVCMLLRANSVFSTAWLLPGQEIMVPTDEFCLHSDFPCPTQALFTPARRTTQEMKKPST